MERNLTIEQIREVLNDMDVPWAENIVDSIVAIRSAAYNEGWDDRDSGVGPGRTPWYDAPTVEEAMKNLDAITEIEFGKPEEDDFSDPGFVVGAVHAQLEELTHREKLVVIGNVLTDIANQALPWTDTNAIDELVDFVRTPEWSVSMLEDIAVIVREARPDIGEAFDEDDDRAWRSH